MDIKILGAESLGVRGLSVYIVTKDRKIIIDPGVALGYRRHGLLPHPFQVAVGVVIRKNIIDALKSSTDLVISHFHGDHVPLTKANPYQLSLDSVAAELPGLKVWAPERDSVEGKMVRRRDDIDEACGDDITDSTGVEVGPYKFSSQMPHGEYDNGLGDVIITRIESGDTVFVHGSDIQLLEEKPIRQIIDWKPDIALVGGPPIYLPQLSDECRKEAWENALTLSRNVDTLLIDHHLLRSRGGIRWLKELDQKTKNYVGCAADFMDHSRVFLEAWRETLYHEMNVPDGWHKAYERGQINTTGYRKWRGWDLTKILPV